VFKTVGSTVLGGLWADFYSSMKTLGATGLGGLWAFWAWHSAETNLRTRMNAIVEYLDYVDYLDRDLSVLAFIVSEISAFIGHKESARQISISYSSQDLSVHPI